MKILCLIDNLGSGGAQRQMTNLALLLQKKGNDIDFVLYGKDDFFADVLKSSGIPITIVKNRNKLERVYRVRNYIRKSGVDIVISFLETPNFLACLSAVGKHSWKLIINERSSNLNSFISKKSRIFKWFARYCDKIVCNSINGKNLWLKYYPQYKDKLMTIYNTVLVSEPKSQPAAKNASKRKILVAASYQRLKNMDGVIEAVKALPEDFKERLEINWYGQTEVVPNDTKAYDAAAMKIKDLCLEDTIHFYQPAKDIITKMVEADCVALFSFYEGFPNAICEGMVLSKPIIMSHVSDYTVLVDENNGFLCSADDIESIKEALMQFLCATEDELRNMGIASKEKAKLLFDNEFITKQWFTLFNHL